MNLIMIRIDLLVPAATFFSSVVEPGLLRDPERWCVPNVGPTARAEDYPLASLAIVVVARGGLSPTSRLVLITN